MVVGNVEPQSAAATDPRPFMASEERVAYASPAASDDSMFWSEPITLKRPIGRMTERYVTRCPDASAFQSGATATSGSESVAAAGRSPTGATPSHQAIRVPSATATSPPGNAPLNFTRPK